MSNPYQPSRAEFPPIRRSWRFVHSLTALASGLVVPPLAAILTASLFFPDAPLARGNSTFWGALVLGSVLAAAAVYRHKRIPLWLAAAIGPAVVFTLALAPILWSEVLGAA